MIELRFRIEFATPFRVSAGHAAAGVDAAVDPDDPLPATSLKGVMRATAGQLIGRHHHLVDAVFGSPAAESPWAWSSAVPINGQWSTPQPISRIKLDAHHTAEHDMLAIAEQIHTGAAVFTITQRANLPTARVTAHRALLTIAAQATRSLGANRRRGLGWVHITSTSHPVDRADVELLLTTGSTA